MEGPPLKNHNDNSIEPTGAECKVARRHFLKASVLVVAGLSALMSPLSAAESGDTAGNASTTKVSFGIVTDAHYADKPGGRRVYLESLAKMTECVKLMNDKKVDFLVELGDFIDKGEGHESALEHLDAIETIYKKFNGPRYHVLGNHDMDSMSKQQFLERVENTGIDKEATYYSYDRKGVHFVVLDACFTSEGKPYGEVRYGWKDTNIPPEELEWLKKDLASTDKPVIVFCHQLLCGEGAHYVNNAAEVRQVLEDDKNVLGVFTGHDHGGKHSQIEGIHYYTLKAMVEGSGEENNAYAIVDIHEDNSMTVTGYRKADSQNLEP